jgi:hypothetical protein
MFRTGKRRNVAKPGACGCLQCVRDLARGAERRSSETQIQRKTGASGCRFTRPPLARWRGPRRRCLFAAARRFLFLDFPIFGMLLRLLGDADFLLDELQLLGHTFAQ